MNADVVIIGAGPAGIFTALEMVKKGSKQKIIMVEKGQAVENRHCPKDKTKKCVNCKPYCHITTGFSGAGAFSDGKLTTGTKSPLIRTVLQTFVDHGAPEDILYIAKPHVGTDLLKGVVRSMRQEIIQLGGQVRFDTRLTGLMMRGESMEGITVLCGGETQEIRTDTVILAIGHSARDTFAMLRDAGIPMEPKPFAVGVRIEHRQSDMDAQQYKQYAGHPSLPPTSYKLSAHTAAGRGVFSFCVCPGGEVVAAASEEKRVVTNGMSEFARDGENINGGLLVSVTPEDFPSGDTLAGVQFQRELEDAAYRLGGGNYAAPAQRVEDFLKHRPSTGAGKVVPTYLPSVRWCDLHGCLPPFVCEALEEGLPMLGRKLRGFDAPDAVLTAVETRSSSPVRIVRDNLSFQSALRGLYPCGEGAGYAGGIMSAAADGLRVAEMILEELNHE